MEKRDVREILINFGINEEIAEYYASLEINDNKWAWLSAFRFVRPLNNQLEKYKCGYAQMMRRLHLEGRGIPSHLVKMFELGLDDELINQFAFDIALTSFNEVLYRISDPDGGDYDINRVSQILPKWNMNELTKDNEKTKRFIPELHSLIPFDRW